MRSQTQNICGLQDQRLVFECIYNERIKSYFGHTHPSLQSLVPTLSPLLGHSLRVSRQADCSRLLDKPAACKHQSCLTQSSSKRLCHLTDLPIMPPTIPYGNDRCTQAPFAVSNTRVRSNSCSFFPRLGLCVFGLRPVSGTLSRLTGVTQT